MKTFFFGDHPVFERKKRLNFRAFREIPSQFSDKPCETDSRIMKIRVKVVCTFLTLSKKPPPPFSKSWLRACLQLSQITSYGTLMVSLILWNTCLLCSVVQLATVSLCLHFIFANLMDILWLVIVLLWSFCTGSAANYYYYIYHTRWRLYGTTFFIECLAGKL